MSKQEYLTVIELSKIHNITTRNVRRIVTKLSQDKTKDLIYRDASNCWMVHRLLSPKFKPQRTIKQKYYALTIDPPTQLKENEIDIIMKFVISRMDNPNIEVNYVVEQKKENNRNHIHCYINCNQRKRLLENLKIGFSNLNYKQTEIFDLEGWKQYITKDGAIIKTLKN